MTAGAGVSHSERFDDMRDDDDGSPRFNDQAAADLPTFRDHGVEALNYENRSRYT